MAKETEEETSEVSSYERENLQRTHRMDLRKAATSGNKTPAQRAAAGRAANMEFKAGIAGKLDRFDPKNSGTLHAIQLAKDSAALKNATSVQHAVLGGEDSSGLVSDDTLGYTAPGAQRYESAADKMAKIKALRGGVSGYGGREITSDAQAEMRRGQLQDELNPLRGGIAASGSSGQPASLRDDPINFIKWDA